MSGETANGDKMTETPTSNGDTSLEMRKGAKNGLDYRCSHVETIGDRRIFRVEGRIAAQFPVQLLSNFSEDATERDSASETRFFSIEGVASSTSVDTYGTEMSLDALKSMETQIGRGIPILPRHNSQFAGGIGEWDEVIGRTVSSNIISINTRNPANKDEKQYVLNVRSILYNSEPKTRQLLDRLKRSEPIGQSVGGWFEDVDVIENRGEVERVIIKKVTLDHIAITRAPANPDSTDLKGLSILRDAISNYPSMDIRKALPFSRLPKAPEDTPWAWNTKSQDEILGPDGNNWTQYKKAHLYQDVEADPKTKGAYKLPIAKMIDGSLKVVLRGVQAAMGAINGARGGVDIPRSDKEIIYRTLKKYYKLFDKDAPPLRSLGAEAMESEKTVERTSEDITSEEREKMLDEKEQMLNEKELMLAEKERMLNDKQEERAVDEEEEEIIAEDEEEDEDEDEDRSTAAIENSNSSSPVEKESDEDGKFDKPELSVQDTVINSDNSATLSNGDNMTETDLGKLAALISNAVKPLAERMDALEKKTVQPEVEAQPQSEERSDTAEVTELKNRLQQAETQINRMLERPLRSGIHTMQMRRGLEGKSYLERSIVDARSNGSLHLARAAEDAKDILTSEKFPQNVNLVEMLARGLRAAEMDGLLNSSIPSNDWK